MNFLKTSEPISPDSMDGHWLYSLHYTYWWRACRTSVHPATVSKHCYTLPNVNINTFPYFWSASLPARQLDIIEDPHCKNIKYSMNTCSVQLTLLRYPPVTGQSDINYCCQFAVSVRSFVRSFLRIEAISPIVELPITTLPGISNQDPSNTVLNSSTSPVVLICSIKRKC